MSELNKLSDQELSELVEAQRTEVQQHRFGTGGRNVKAVRTAKKNIARALTLLTARSKTTTK